MGKKNKHSKDKLHKTVSELKSHHVGANRDLELSVLHRRLKFDSCCLSLNTITGTPVGLSDTDNYCHVFDCDHIVRFLEKYQIHPVTGAKVSASNLIKLKFHRNNEGRYHCPVNLKLFNQLSKIIANKKNGNVYSFEAYQQLNVKSNNFKDLLTDEPFEREDIVIIQDPNLAEVKWNVSDFYFVKNKLKYGADDDSDQEQAGCSVNIRNIDKSSILKSSLDEYKSKSATIVEKFNTILGQDVDESQKVDTTGKITSSSFSDGTLARSVTSTVMPVANTQKTALLNKDELIYPRVKKKGYVQVVTNFGNLNLELYCDRTPKTCHNFLLLASRGYYNNTCFHRLVKNFIIQGGDPTSSGLGGESAWGGSFQNECHADLKHDRRGVLAMANSGPDTNKSQFYITFSGSWDHLDGKHTVFGRVVGGDDTLTRMESVEVDKKDRPKREIKILEIKKFTDPFQETELMLNEEQQTKLDGNKRKSAEDSKHSRPLKKYRSGVGAYINLDSLGKNSKVNNESQELINDDKTSEEQDTTSLSAKLSVFKAKDSKSHKTFGNFLNW